jgi:hypothetical protein
VSLAAEEAFDRAFEARVAERRRDQLAGLGDEPAAWIALVPAWTERLAHACDFPSGSEPLADLFARAEAAGLCERSRAASATLPTWYRCQALAELAPGLPPDLLTRAFAVIRSIPHERTRADGLARLAPHLPPDLLGDAIATVGDIQNEGARATALAGLAPHLPRALLEKALALGRALDDPADRVMALSSLGAALPPRERSEVLGLALHDAFGIDDPARRALALASLVPHASTPVEGASGRANRILASAVEAAAAVDDPIRRAEVLARLAPVLPPGLLAEVSEIARAIEDPDSRHLALAALATAAPDADRPALAREAAAAVAGIDDPATRAMRQSEAAAVLATAGAGEDAKRLAETLDDEVSRFHAIGQVAEALAAHGDTSLALRVALPALDATIDGSTSQGASAVLGVARHLTDTGDFEAAVRIVERTLGSEQIPADTTSIRAARDAALVLRATGDDQRAHRVAQQAAEAARHLSEPRQRCEALLSLAPLVDDALADALTAAREVGEPAGRLRALLDLLPHLEARQRTAVAAEAFALAEAPGDELSFHMPAAVRPTVLATLRRSRGPRFLEQAAATVGKRLRDVGTRQPVPAVVARWAEVAAIAGEQGSAGAATWLDRRIDDLVRSGETGAALAWAEAGAALAQVLGGELEAVALLGQRRVELLHRQAQDRRHLRRFLRRDEQLQDIGRLLDQPEDGWALHLLGNGGVGKTMLLRHVMAELAPAREIPTGRLDFDHISPDYPARRPGQLLLGLADELRAHFTNTQQEQVFRYVQGLLVKLHEGLSDRPSRGDPLDAVHGDDLERALHAFADLVGLLPQPVLLMLDTCEELAKLQPLGARLPAVEATFSILERLHELAPGLRVLFAGRRLLARAGRDWSAAASDEATALLPDDKDYLRLHWVRGFTEQEAATFLSGVRPLARSAALREAVVARSRETERDAPVVWRPPRPGGSDIRYNPFDLALYADWVREAPDLDPAVIASGRSDQYIEARVVGRVQRGDVRAILPAIALLGRFDRAMLRPAFRGDDDAFADLWRELAATEWLDFQHDAALRTSFLEVDRNLHGRLLGWYGQPVRRSLLDDAAGRLGPGLAELVAGRPLGHLGIDHVDAALRLLPAAEAADVWDQLEARVAAEAAWDWARAVTERLLGENGATVDRGHPLHAAVLATHCAALLHEQPSVPLVPLWAEVETTASTHPDPETATWLRRRAVLGRIAGQGLEPPERQLQEIQEQMAAVGEGTDGAGERGRVRAEQLAASLCAAIEALVERADQTNDAHTWALEAATRIRDGADRLAARQVSPPLVGFALSLAARALAHDGRWSEAGDDLRRALAALEGQGGDEPVRQRWLGWRAPDGLLDRVRLEALRALPPEDRRMWPQDTWWREAAERTHLIDAERLVSAVLRVRLAAGPLPATDLEALAASERYLPDRQPVCNAHRAVPPLFATLALGWLALGDGVRALDLLDHRLDEAVASGRDRGTIDAAELARLEVVRRLRLIYRGPALLDAGWPAWALTRSAAGAPPSPTSPEILHAWWRCQPGLTGPDARRAIERLAQASGEPAAEPPPEDAIQVGGRAYPLPPDASHGEFALALDWIEAARVAGESPLLPITLRVRSPYATHPRESEVTLRFGLRAVALGVDEAASDEVHTLASQVGLRRAAELALDEGELLALRLPRHALELLRLAAAWFHDTGDLAGELIARMRAFIAWIHAHATGGPAGSPRPGHDRPPSAVREAYERFAASSPTLALPALAELEAAAASPDAERLDELARHPSWGGWLERLLACLAWVRRGSPDPVISRWLRNRHQDGLPAELNLAAEVVPAAQPPPPVARGRRLSRRARRVLIWLGLLAVFVGSGFLPATDNGVTFIIASVFASVATLGLVLLPMWWLFRSPRRRQLVTWLSIVAIAIASGSIAARLYGSLGSTLGGLCIAAGVAAGFLPIWWVLDIPGRVDARRAARLRLDLEARALPKGNEVALRLSWVETWLVRLRRRGTPPAGDRQGTWPVPLPGPYAEAAPTLPEPVVEALAGVARRLRRRSVAVALDVDRAAARLPWEALLSLAVPTSKPARVVDRFRPWRAELASPDHARRQATAPGQGVLYRGDPRWASLSERAWSGILSGWTHEWDDTSPSNATGPAKVLHLIGVPVETAAGLRLRLGDPGAGAMRQSAEAAVRGEVALLAVDRLPLDRYQLVVLQEDPVAGAARLDSERERTASMRELAADAFAAGAAAVVLVPALPPKAAEDALPHLAKPFRKPAGDPGRQALLDAVGRVRRHIATWSNEAWQSLEDASEQWAHTRLELALDVTLFARRDANLDGRG